MSPRAPMWLPRPALRLAGFVVLVAAVLVPAHDLVYLADHGFHEHAQALEGTGHGSYWTAAWYVALLAVAATTILAVQQSAALRRRLSGLGGVRVLPVPRGRLLAGIARRWLAVLVAALAIFVVQENLEYFALDPGHLPGLGVLVGVTYAWTIPVFAALALLVSIVGSLALERLRALARAVERALRQARPTRRLPRPPQRSGLGIRARRGIPDLGRAPPHPLAS